MAGIFSPEAVDVNRPFCAAWKKDAIIERNPRIDFELPSILCHVKLRNRVVLPKPARPLLGEGGQKEYAVHLRGPICFIWIIMIKNTRKSKMPSAVKLAGGKPEISKPLPASTAAPKSEAVAVKAAPVAPKQTGITAPPPATATTPAPRTGCVSLELVKPGAHNVYVAGSFNEWKPELAPLVAAGNDRWVGNLEVKPGRYEYLFVVDGQWLPDPNAKETIQNPFGGKNSVLFVAA